MYSDEKDYDDNQVKFTGTGSHHPPGDDKTIVYPFGKYEIKVKLSANNEFMGIMEVKINKEFVSNKQKMSPKGFHDVDEFYPE